MEVVGQIRYWLGYPALKMVGKEVIADGKQGKIVAIAFDNNEFYLVQEVGMRKYLIHPDLWSKMQDPITKEKVWKA